LSESGVPIDFDEIARQPGRSALAAPTMAEHRSSRRSPSAKPSISLWDRPWITFVGGALLVALAALLPLFRQKGFASWQTVYAEDGYIYGHGARVAGPLHALLAGYAGYLQLLPRLLAVPAAWLPVRWWAWYFAVAGTMVTALLAWFCYWATDGWVHSRPVRLALASLVALMPALVSENTATITNTIWALACVAPWALVSLRERRRDTVVRGVVVFLAATATPLTVIFVPIAVGWCAVRRTRSAFMVSGVFGAGLALQLAVVTHTSNTNIAVPIGAAEVARFTAARVFGVFLFGQQGANRIYTIGAGLIFVVAPVLTLALLVALVVLVPRAGWRPVALAAMFLVTAVAFFVVPVVGRGALSLGVPMGPSLAALRFSVVPVMLLASAFAVLVASQDVGRPRLAERIGRPVFVAQVVVVTLLSFSAANYRSNGPQWVRSVDASYAQYCAGRSPDAPAQLRELRFGVFGHWDFTLPCRDLTR
jgi:hypothetical protein